MTALSPQELCRASRIPAFVDDARFRTVGYAVAYMLAVWSGRQTVLAGGTFAVLAPGPGMAALWLRRDLRAPRRLAGDLVLLVLGAIVVLHLDGIRPGIIAQLTLNSVVLGLIYAAALSRWLPAGASLRTPRCVTRLLLICWGGALPTALMLLGLTGRSGGTHAQASLLDVGSFTARSATGAFIVICCALPVLNGQARRDLRSDAANRALAPVLVALLLLELAMQGDLGFPALLLLLGLQVSAATWFSQTLTAWSVATTCVVLLIQDRRGGGPFAGSDMFLQAAYTQFYFGVLAGVVMLQCAFRLQRDALVAVAARSAARVEHQLQLTAESERWYRAAFERAPVGAFVVGLQEDSFCRILRSNAETAAILGLPDPADLVGQSLLDWAAPDQRDLIADRVRQELGADPADGDTDVRFHDASGREIVLRLVTARISPAVHEGSLVLVLVEDVTALRLSQERLQQEALHDTLTQLPNRRLFADRLDQAMAANERESDPVGVLYLDLDGFKQVNDVHGHAAGDDLLRQVAVRLRDVVRPGDTAARLGGDEFALLCPHINADGLQLVAERIVTSLARPVVLADGLTVTVGTSVGAAQSRPAQSAEELVREADTAMYDAKRSGRGQIRFPAPNPGVTLVPVQRSVGAACR